jgi:proton-dependent oligopeptide transporter, POT family
MNENNTSYYKVTLLSIISMLEKFSFHGVRFILVLYVSKYFQFEEPKAYVTYGALMALTYSVPILVGWLLDKVFNLRLLALLGSIFLGAGSLLLCSANINIFYSGLGFIVLGGGTLRSTIPILLGKIYESQPHNKDSAFTLLYVSINLGALLAAITCGYIGEKIGWKYSFLITSLAGFSSFLVLFVTQSTVLRSSKGSLAINIKNVSLILGFIFTAFAIGWVIQHNTFIDFIVLLSLGIVACWLGALYIKNKDNRKKIVKLIHLMMLQTLFFALYEQGPSSFVIFINKFVDTKINFGNFIGQLDVPVTFFQAIDPAANLLVGFLFSYLWYKLLLKKDSEYIKFSLGFFVVGIAYTLISYLPHQFPIKQMPAELMMLIFSLIVIGELLIVPIGLAYVSTIQLPKLKGTLMGIWCLSIGAGQWIATYISRRISINNKDCIIDSLSAYTNIYTFCMLLSISLSLLTIVLYKARRSRYKSIMKISHS